MSILKLRLLPAILSCLVSSAWAAEVSDSLKKLNTIYHATTFVYNYLGVVAGTGIWVYPSTCPRD